MKSFNGSDGSNIVSEQFTYYNMTPEELSAKGKGGQRQMYNYVSASQDLILYKHHLITIGLIN